MAAQTDVKTESGFTPGPWEAKQAFAADGPHRIVWKEYGQGWVRERRLDKDHSGGFSPENARVIAAAPDLWVSGIQVDRLLRRMQRLVTEYLIPDGGITDETLINEIIGMLDGPEQRSAQHGLQAAIAKAEGQL